MVAGRGVGAAIVGAQPPAAMATSRDALEQCCPLSHGTARLVRLRSRIRANAGLVRFIGQPIDEALMVAGRNTAHSARDNRGHPLAHDALVVDIALMAALAVGIGARVDGIGQHAVDRRVGRAAPPDLARRADLRGEGGTSGCATRARPDGLRRARRTARTRCESHGSRLRRDESGPHHRRRPRPSPLAKRGAAHHVPPCCGSRPRGGRAERATQLRNMVPLSPSARRSLNAPG